VRPAGEGGGGEGGRGCGPERCAASPSVCRPPSLLPPPSRRLLLRRRRLRSLSGGPNERMAAPRDFRDIDRSRRLRPPALLGALDPRRAELPHLRPARGSACMHGSGAPAGGCAARVGAEGCEGSCQPDGGHTYIHTNIHTRPLHQKGSRGAVRAVEARRAPVALAIGTYVHTYTLNTRATAA
jgi:hypothetical protein